MLVWESDFAHIITLWSVSPLRHVFKLEFSKLIPLHNPRVTYFGLRFHLLKNPDVYFEADGGNFQQVLDCSQKQSPVDATLRLTEILDIVVGWGDSDAALADRRGSLLKLSQMACEDLIDRCIVLKAQSQLKSFDDSYEGWVSKNIA